jgi:hypothetical protein
MSWTTWRAKSNGNFTVFQRMEWGDCKPMVGLVVVVQWSAVGNN